MPLKVLILKKIAVSFSFGWKRACLSCHFAVKVIIFPNDEFEILLDSVYLTVLKNIGLSDIRNEQTDTDNEK